MASLALSGHSIERCRAFALPNSRFKLASDSSWDQLPAKSPRERRQSGAAMLPRQKSSILLRAQKENVHDPNTEHAEAEYQREQARRIAASALHIW